ncbi:MAG: Cu(I)/Ag(I) efflux system membrane fusion protein [Cognaticolwellia sp.]|jgi:Cu(I)/Ag(I) efflux system membrane fusion protein
MSDKQSPPLLQSAVLRWLGGAVLLLLAFGAGNLLSGDAPETPTDEHAHESQAEVWTCSMHPQIRQGEPGSCPLCGMDLILANSGSSSSSSERVVLSERALALSGLRTTAVRRQTDASAEIHLLGRVEAAESTRRNVTTWIGGRIDRLHVNTTGEKVRKGQSIATLYSPEIYAAHQDLITAQGQVRRLEGASESVQSAAAAALEAARKRLRLLGVPESEVETMAQADSPRHTIAIRSPFSGTVIDRVATQGAYVETGATLFQVADLSTLWVQLDAYESDLSRLRVGQDVELLIEALPGERFPGRVAFIDPTIDSQRRTARVRVVVDNAAGRLRPGMFAEAVVQAASEGSSSPLVIPDSAPLFTGRRSVVYVEIKTEDTLAYEPRSVRLGPRLGDLYPVVSGLTEGDRVVSRGAFALDADLQIRGGASMMTRPDDSSEPLPEAVSLTDKEEASLQPVLTHYLGVQRALAEDDLEQAQASAQSLKKVLSKVELSPQPQLVWGPVAKEISGHASHVAAAGDLAGAREGLEPLSAAVEVMLARFGNLLEEPIQVAFCPMANDGEGARWVQSGEGVDNAYFGNAMRTCGELRATIAPGTTLDTPPASVGAAPVGHQH